MTNIIVHGFVSNKLVTQGYHAGAAVLGGDSRHYYYDKKRKKDEELFVMLRELLMKVT